MRQRLRQHRAEAQRQRPHRPAPAPRERQVGQVGQQRHDDREEVDARQR
ncbi:hypothetical protein [Kouleothrix sp.]